MKEDKPRGAELGDVFGSSFTGWLKRYWLLLGLIAGGVAHATSMSVAQGVASAERDRIEAQQQRLELTLEKMAELQADKQINDAAFDATVKAWIATYNERLEQLEHRDRERSKRGQ